MQNWNTFGYTWEVWKVISNLFVRDALNSAIVKGTDRISASILDIKQSLEKHLIGEVRMIAATRSNTVLMFEYNGVEYKATYVCGIYDVEAVGYAKH